MVAPTKAAAGVKLAMVGLGEDLPHPAIMKKTQPIILKYLSMNTPLNFKFAPPRGPAQASARKSEV
jgi:hypothetical protein